MELRKLTAPLAAMCIVTGSCLAAPLRGDPALRSRVPERWWESASAIVRVSLKPGRMGQQFPLNAERAAPILDELKAKGISAIEIFAPAEGGRSFSGLDTIDRYRIEPELGTIDDFRKLVRLIHSRGMAVISFDNLGYSSVEAIDFLKACDDVRAGRDSREVRFFIWGESAAAPPPVRSPGDRFFMVRPTHLPGAEPGTFYDSSKDEIWQYSERAHKYYWSKWAGVDLAGNKVRLPQYDWGSPEFQDEAEKVVRFWMDTGLDGMIIDAVNWYVGHTWASGRKRMTGVIAGYPNTYSQPEGAGGFHEDPVAWITEGGWDSVQDYGLGIWWEKGSDVIGRTIETNDPRPIESALRDYHDRVVASGGVLYLGAERRARFSQPEKRRLAFALSATVGDLVALGFGQGQRLFDDPEVARLLKLRAAHPALHQLSTRRALPVRDSARQYAFLRTARDASERILVVLNFDEHDASVEVDTSGLAASGLVDLSDEAQLAVENPLRIALHGYGYRLFRVKPEVGLK